MNNNYYTIFVDVKNEEQPNITLFTFEAKGYGDFNELHQGMINYIPKFARLHKIPNCNLLISTSVEVPNKDYQLNNYASSQIIRCVDLEEVFTGVYKDGEFLIRSKNEKIRNHGKGRRLR